MQSQKCTSCMLYKDELIRYRENLEQNIHEQLADCKQ